MEPESYDCLAGKTLTIPILDHGHVTLVDCHPRLVPKGRDADFMIVQAARQSYGNSLKSVKEDVGLLNYLFRHQHWSPVEFVRFTFHLKIPIFVARQLFRHRMMNASEYSLRYSEAIDEWYTPETFRTQDPINKQGSSIPLSDSDAESARIAYESSIKEAFKTYQSLLAMGISREQARCVLPVAMYTSCYISMDLRNLFNLLHLRLDSHAQYEIRVMAAAMHALINPIIPNAMLAWENYIHGSLILTKQEVDAIHVYANTLPCGSANEKREYQDKLDRLFDGGPESVYFL